jgi:peroxiredoxin
MAASLKQDYAKILQAGAELVMVSSDSLEQHRQYAQTLFGEELPYLFVSDRTLDIAATVCYARRSTTTAAFTIARSGY